MIVSDADTTPLNVRHQPSASSGVKFTVPIRELVSIISGPVCEGNLVWWEIGRNGNSGWAAEINGYNNRNLLLNGEPLPGGGNSGSGNTGNTPISTTQPQATTPVVRTLVPARDLITVPVQLVDGTYFGFEYDRGRNVILNGSEYVISQIRRLQGSSFSEVVVYLTPYSESDMNKSSIETALCGDNASCKRNLVYLIGVRTMDTSEVGNLIYGYYEGVYGFPLITNAAADIDQTGRELIQYFVDRVGDRVAGSIWDYIVLNDNPDDVRQREVGLALSRGELSAESLNQLAEILALF